MKNFLNSFVLILSLVVANNKICNAQSVTFEYLTYANGYHVSCYGATNSQVRAGLTGGAHTPYTYLWSNGNTTHTLSNVHAGNYIVTITNSQSATFVDTAHLTQPSALGTVIYMDDFNGYNISEYGNNGMISAEPTGGSPPYTFLWSTNDTISTLELTAGTYTVTVTDANGCTNQQTRTLTQPDQLVITNITLSQHNGYNISCNGGNNGTVSISVTGGVPPYRYAGNFPDTSYITDLSAGDYDLTIIDQNDVKADDDFTLTEPPLIETSLTPQLYPNNYNVSCYQCYNGSINTSVSGGVGSYTYLWSNAATTANLTTLGAGAYTVTVSDANSCTSNANVTLTEIPREDWTVTGNSNVDSTKFIGTNDSTNVILKTNGQERLSITSSGDIKITKLMGVSTTDLVVDDKGELQRKNLPDWNVAGNSIMSDYFIGSLNAADLIFKTDAANTNLIGEKMRIKVNGKVGIGTTTPSQKLEIAHNDANGGIALNRTNSVDASKSQISFQHNGTPKWAIGMDLENLGTQDFYIYDDAAGSSRLYIDPDGRTGIGMVPPTDWDTPVEYKLYVADGIATRDVKVTAGDWPDYVFEKEHNLMSIYELDNFIKANKHLPGVKSADEIKKEEGFSLGEMLTVMLKKLEEQTLYIIALQKQLDELNSKLK